MAAGAPEAPTGGGGALTEEGAPRGGGAPSAATATVPARRPGGGGTPGQGRQTAQLILYAPPTHGNATDAKKESQNFNALLGPEVLQRGLAKPRRHGRPRAAPTTPPSPRPRRRGGVVGVVVLRPSPPTRG